MRKKYLLGLDISTTGAKALLIDFNGKVIATAVSALQLSTPLPLWSEQNPADWWDGIAKSIRSVLDQSGAAGEEIVAIGLTGQMHGLVLLNASGEVLRPAILWNDQRTAQECDEIRECIGKERLIRITGNDALTGFTAPKLLWVHNHEPQLWSQITHILLPKDYIRYRLTEQFALDRAGGAGTLLFDLSQRSWSHEVVQALDIPESWLPSTFEGPQVTGTVSAEAAAITGLQPDIPVVAGAGDQAAQAVGVGAVEPGIVALTLGTSGVVFATTTSPVIEPQGRLHAFCHAVPDRWHLMGVMLSAAGSLQWYRDTLAPGIDFASLVDEAVEIPPGADGLFFLPYLTGERTPHPDPSARGAWIGLTVRHQRAHLTRALLEGVAFGIKDILELLQNSGQAEIRQVRISGGGARSTLWRQILADVLQTELITVATTEGAAYGAAILAGVGVGIWENVDEACKRTVEVRDVIEQKPKSAVVYNNAYAHYRELYPILKDWFWKL